MKRSLLADRLRAKIAAYTWQFNRISDAFILREYLRFHQDADHQSDAMEDTAVRILQQAIEHKLVDFNELTTAGYDVIMRGYSRQLCRESVQGRFMH